MFLLKFKIIIGSFVAALVLVAGGTIWAYFALRRITEPLILHYNGQRGISQIGDIWNLLAFGGMGFIMLALNFGIALALEERHPFWGKIVAVANLILGVLIFIGLMAIISVN